MTEMSLNVFANCELLLGIILTGVFTYRYGVLSRWYITRIGRSLLFLMGFLVLYFSFALYSNIYPDFPGRPVVRIIIYSGMDIGFIGMVVNLIRTQIESKKSQKALKDEAVMKDLDASVQKKDKNETR